MCSIVWSCLNALILTHTLCMVWHSLWIVSESAVLHNTCMNVSCCSSCSREFSTEARCHDRHEHSPNLQFPLLSLHTDSYTQLSYENVSWHHSDVYIITIATDGNPPDIDYVCVSQNGTRSSVSLEGFVGSRHRSDLQGRKESRPASLRQRKWVTKTQ